mgnify:FL=1
MPGDFPYDLTAHASKIIGEREIPMEWVARTLARPERTEADAVDPALRHALAHIPEYGGRVLRVIYNSTVKPWRIITVYFDRKERSGA